MYARVLRKQNRICQTCPCYKSLDFVIRFGLTFSKGFNNQAHRSRVLFRTTGRGNITHHKKGETKTLLTLSTIYPPPKNQSERIPKDTTLTLPLQVKNTNTPMAAFLCVSNRCTNHRLAHYILHTSTTVNPLQPSVIPAVKRVLCSSIANFVAK